MKLLIIIPAYNEEGSIERVVDNLTLNFPMYDYVVVNDGSSDKTLDVLKKRGFCYIDLPVNLGLTGAIRAGMMYADVKDYDYAVQLDGDGQHDPAYIEEMCRKMKDASCDIVIGSRFSDGKKPASMRMAGSNLISGAIKLTTGKRIYDVTSGMRLFNRRIIKRFAKDMNCSPEPDTLAYLLNCGAKIEEVQVTMHERTAGKSYLTFGSSLWYMIKMMFSILLFQWVRGKEKEDVN